MCEEEVCIPSEQPVLYAMRQAWVNIVGDIQGSSLPGVMDLSIHALEMTLAAIMAWFSLSTVVAWPVWVTLSESYAVIALIASKAWKRMAPWSRSAFAVFYRAMRVLLKWEKSQQPSVWLWQAVFLSLCALAFVLYRRRMVIEAYLVSARAGWQFCVKQARLVYLKFIASLSKLSNSMVQFLPPICYWGGTFAMIYLYPSYVSDFINITGGWHFVTLILPLVKTLVALLRPGASISVPLFDVDRILLYWVIYAIITCVGHAVLWVPGAQFLISLVPLIREVTFFVLLLLQLPQAICKPRLAYGAVENVLGWWNTGHVHRKIISQALSVLVTLGILSERRAQHIAINVADSWQMIPAFLVFLLPYQPFLELGCFYTGHLVPALNTTKAMKSHQATAAEQQPVQDLELKFRWLSYWCVFASFKVFVLYCSSILDWIPLRKQGEILFNMWLQFPYFRGGIWIVGGMIRLVERRVKFSRGKKDSSKSNSSRATLSSHQRKASGEVQHSPKNNKHRAHLLEKKKK